MPGLIFTADLHGDITTLDLLDTVFTQMEHTIAERGLQGVVILGDLKSRYNPIDGRVVNFMLDWMRRFKRVWVLLGNHDRFSLNGVQNSWLPALEKAGAKVYMKQGVDVIACGSRKVALYFLPYRRDTRHVRQSSNVLAHRRSEIEADEHILCFHCGLREAYYSVLRTHSAQEEGVSVKDLHAEVYDHCLGGHFHMRQHVKYPHVWYVGSPFAVDWGDVNQQKGFAVLEV